MAVFVVIWQTLTSKLEFLGWLNSVAVVITQNPLSIWFVQSQRITDAVRNIGTYRNSPSFNLDPVATLLIDGVAVKVQEGVKAGISLHDLIYHQMINICEDFFISAYR